MTIWQPSLTNNATAKYKQLADAIAQAITDGTLSAGEKLPPQRQLAYALAVTVGTITRAYSEAERRGIVTARVGSGTYVKESKDYTYLSQHHDCDYFDLNSAKAPMGMQVTMMATALKEVANEPQVLESCLLYQPETSLLHQREQLAAWLSERGIVCTENNVLFSYGGQHGISLALQSFCRAGDTLLCEGLSFPGIKVACQQQQLKCIGLAIDEMGLIPEALIAACLQGNPRVLYLTAQMQNPTSVKMPEARKRQIAEICIKNDIIIIDDDVQFLPNSDKVVSFYQLCPENTIYISSFSKSFSGGLRLGYTVSNDNIRAKLQVSLRASCWTLPPLTIEIVCRWLNNGQMTQVESWLSTEMAQRNIILQEVLTGFDFTHHPRGFNAWLALPEPWRAVDFVDYALKKGVLVRAAESYAVGRFSAPQNIRLCISAPKDQAELRLALNLLKTCLLATPTSGSLVM